MRNRVEGDIRPFRASDIGLFLSSVICHLSSGSSTSGTGYVVDSLEAALWAFHRSDSFKEGALLVVNLGDDTDTTGAVYGQIAGAYYGIEGIPINWVKILALGSKLEEYADRLKP